MKIWKKFTGIALALCMAAAVMAVPNTQAFAKVSVDPKKITIPVGSTYETDIDISYSMGDAKITKIKSSSKNLYVKQTYQYYHDTLYTNSEHPYGYATLRLYAKKPGKYKVTFQVCNAQGKKVSKHTVQVTAKTVDLEYYNPAIKKVTFAGKQDVFGTMTNKKSGKFKVTMQKGYKLNSIIMRYYDANGNWIEKPIKNNSKVTLSSYSYKYEHDYRSSYNPSSWYYYMSAGFYAETSFRVEYMNKKTKEDSARYYYLYRMPVN